MLLLVAIVAALLLVSCGVAACRRSRSRATGLTDARVAALKAFSAEGLIVLDEHDDIAWVSDAALEILGAGREALVGRRPDEVADAELRSLLGRVDVRLSRGHDDDIVVERRREGAAVQHVSLGGAELRTPTGEYLGAALWMRDLTLGLLSERRLRDSEARYRRLVEAAQEMIWTCDRDLVITSCNRAVEDMLGYPAEAVVGRAVAEGLPRDRAEEGLDALRRVLAGETRVQLETSVRRADGEVIDVAHDIVPLWGDNGIVGVSAITRDVSTHRQAEAERQRAAARQAAVAELGRRALAVTGPDLVVEDAARTLSSVLGLPSCAVLELDPVADALRAAGSNGDPAVIRAAELRSPAEQTSHAGLALRTQMTTSFSDLSRDDRFPADVALLAAGVRCGIAVPVLVRDRTFGLLVGYGSRSRSFGAEEFAIAQSVANVVGSAVERVELDRADRERALHDALTALPNRTLFTDRLRGAVARARRTGSHTAVLMLGVDGFKAVNEKFGRNAGDDLLSTIAHRLRSEIRAGDTVARLGGDEFVILCEGLAGERDAIQVADKLAGLWDEPFVLSAGEVYVTASIGVAVVQGGGAGADDLLRDADAAMERAKQRGRGRFELADEDLRVRVAERMRLELELRRALDRDEFRLVYQPVVDLRTGTVAGAEALLRWEHPELGVVSPLQFIPAAEKTGDIVHIGEWVLREACSQAARLQERWPEFRLSVNVSGRQVGDPGLPDRVAQIIAEAGLAPGTLGLEITESVLMEADGDPEVILGRLREAGAHLLLDDFGTGYSSLSYLKRFPLDTLKIDRSFVDGLGAEDEDSAIVAAIVQLASTLDLTVVAEGVETGAQLELLTDLRCDLAQGYLLSRPVDAATLEGLLGDGVRPVLPV
jgi:diguanylate cyclase (GGDEF)-like protein/PAS domain S-box-containing protein